MSNKRRIDGDCAIYSCFHQVRWYDCRLIQDKQGVAGNKVSSYIDRHILGCWRHLTMSLTNNASERFNRKIEKCFSGRYGIASLTSAKVLLQGLWFKELLVHGRKHMDATSEMATIDLSTICQEHLDTSKILHFFHDNDPSRLEKLG